jgi:hypothetical protein
MPLHHQQVYVFYFFLWSSSCRTNNPHHALLAYATHHSGLVDMLLLMLYTYTYMMGYEDKIVHGAFLFLLFLFSFAQVISIHGLGIYSYLRNQSY